MVSPQLKRLSFSALKIGLSAEKVLPSKLYKSEHESPKMRHLRAKNKPQANIMEKLFIDFKKRDREVDWELVKIIFQFQKGR